MYMKIDYPCINYSIGRKCISTFRLASFTNERLIQSIKYNLDVLNQILYYNIEHKIYFFRISSDIIPFASHPICKLNWKHIFRDQLIEIGEIINKYQIRISMHPDQFVLINSPDRKIVSNSISELRYHAELLDLLNLNYSAKIQIHVGGVYGNKEKFMNEFISNYDHLLPDTIKKRLVIENDDFRYNLKDCIRISDELGIPILLDIFHHEWNDSQNMSMLDAIYKSDRTWKRSRDGIPMMDYSSQQPNERKGKHASTIDMEHFNRFFSVVSKFDFDLMLEIKDKEKSALRVIEMLEATNKFR